MNTIAVDYEYFETLNIGLKEGRFFHTSFPADSANAVINETAAKAMNLKDPMNAMINGCGGHYRIIGVIKDVKAYGFEENAQPTVYLMNDHCGLNKTQILIKADQHAIPGMLKTLDHQWVDINKLDGDNFNYHFLDELYEQLFVKQKQLQQVLTGFSILAIFIAALGLFSLAAHFIRLRMKEIAIRKVFGASSEQLIFLLSKPFFYIFIIANLIAWPVTFMIANRWLETFAYRVHLSIAPFIFSMIISAVVLALTVCLQIIKALQFNPAMKLKV